MDRSGAPDGATSPDAACPPRSNICRIRPGVTIRRPRSATSRNCRRRFKRSSPEGKRPDRASGGQPFATLATAVGDHPPATDCGHAAAEAMPPFADLLARLKSALHGRTPSATQRRPIRARGWEVNPPAAPAMTASLRRLPPAGPECDADVATPGARWHPNRRTPDGNRTGPTPAKRVAALPGFWVTGRRRLAIRRPPDRQSRIADD